jgi:hypothetical protein
MKKKILYLLVPTLLAMTACTTSFGVGTGVGFGGSGSSVSIGASAETASKKKDDKKANENKAKEKLRATVKKHKPKKAITQNIVKNNKVEAVVSTEVNEAKTKVDNTVKRVKQERQE